MANKNIWPLVFYTCLIVAITSFVCCGCWILKRITDIRKKREQQTIIAMFRDVLSRRAPPIVQAPVRVPYRQNVSAPAVLTTVPGAISPTMSRAPISQAVPIHTVRSVGYGTQSAERVVTNGIPPNQVVASPNMSNNHAPVGNGYIPSNPAAPVGNGYIPVNQSGPVANGYGPTNPGTVLLRSSSRVEAPLGYASVHSRNPFGKMLRKVPGLRKSSSIHNLGSNIPENEIIRPITRVNTVDELDTYDMDERFFVAGGGNRIHVDSMEAERARIHGVNRSQSVRSHEQQAPRVQDPQPVAQPQPQPQPVSQPRPVETQPTRAREKPAPPVRKTVPKDIVNPSPVDEFPPPPPYTETDTDPVVENFRNVYRIQCMS